jgi:murein DD-endopeptidase MepM/ murein hydrolase activator NlpD
MSTEISALVERARAAAQKPVDPAAGATSDRGRLEKVAQEFESMLLTQVLRDMRKSGAWEDEESGDTLGAETMYDTLDVELAGHLAHVQGFGLSKQLLEAFDRLNGGGGPKPEASGLSEVEASGVRPLAPASRTPEPVELKPEPSSVKPHVIAPGPEASGLRPDVSPVEGKVTSSFGWRHDPFTGQSKFHRGVDLKAVYGQDVRAAGDGRVVFSGTQGGYGTTVLVEHQDGTRTRYAHLSAALVSAGDTVGAGQAVGQAGHSGRATGTHVHFEVIAPNGQPLDPRASRQVALRATAQGGGSGG